MLLFHQHIYTRSCYKAEVYSKIAETTLTTSHRSKDALLLLPPPPPPCMEATTPLLTPYKMGKFNLAHRSYENMAQPHNALYYEQRAAPGVLLIAEACAVSPETARAGFSPVPGLWSHEQVEAWKPAVDAVHAKGALFFCQIWHTGRGIPPTEAGRPPRLEAQDIPQMVKDFRIAARNAVKAGFDGVEIHAANGFLVNQFWWFIDTDPLRQDRSSSVKNANDDEVTIDGGIPDNSCRRLATDVVAAVADEIGAHRVGVRFSPFAACTDDADPEAHALQLIQTMDELGVLYSHVVEPRTTRTADGGDGSDGDGKLAVWRRLLPLRKAFRGTFMVNGGYGREEGDEVIASGYADLVSYGRLFLANPDLPERFRKKAGLNKYDRSTFYTSHPVLGYTDYPFLAQETPVAQ